MKKILWSILIVLLAGLAPVKAQKNDLGGKEGDMLEDAEFFYEEGNFLRALPLYVELANLHPDELYYKLRAGICYMYKTDEKEKSLAYLDTVYKAKPDVENILFYLGKSHHLNYKFDDAIRLLTDYTKGKGSPDLKKRASQIIIYCNNAKELVQKPIKAEIQNLGNVVNTSASEFAPVISSDESVLIFTYRGERSTGGLLDPKFKKDDKGGEYYEDIFITQKIGNNWLSPEPIGVNINTKGHDASIALSADGQILFVYKSTPKDNGDIYMSKLQGETWSAPVSLGSNVNTSSWEGSCSLSSDGQTLYFASERPGGSGGRDIYMSKKQADGKWGKAVNLGPTVNTPLNDDAPFIHPDRVTLFFSSEGHNSMGGSDIFYTHLKEDKWTAPTNLGFPINSTEDDRYYVLSADGEKGYYSSNAKGGYGQQDLYAVTPGYNGERPILALVVGVVTANDKPVDATIKVTNNETGQLQGTYNSNSSTGKYLIALTPGNSYKVAIEVEGFEPLLEYINVKSLDTYVQVQKDMKLYTDDYKKQNGITVADSTESLQVKLDQQIARYREESKLQVYEAKVYQDLLNKYGDIRKDSVSYTVELGTYENPKDFDASKYASLGNIESKLDTSGNTTYSVGPFKTLLDAEIFRSKLMQQDTSMRSRSVVTVNDKGDRKMVQQYYANEYKRTDYTAPTNTKVIKSQQTSSTNTVVDVQDRTRYQDLMKDYGKAQIEGLTFKLEIAALNDTNDFKLQKLAQYGKIERRKYPDGVYRYTLGPFNTLSEADSFKMMLARKEPEIAKSLITVFYFGQRKTMTEFFDNPCAPERPQVDFAFFVGKDLNDTAVYNKLIRTAGDICAQDLVFRVQIGAYRYPQNFKYKNLKDLEPPPALVKPYADGITRFTMREFKTLREAELFRQTCIRKGTKDAWITGEYKGERKLLQEMIANNFYGNSVN
jgi:hypothetical protein